MREKVALRLTASSRATATGAEIAAQIFEEDGASDSPVAEAALIEGDALKTRR